jgi:prepilin peptidase CpaA
VTATAVLDIALQLTFLICVCFAIITDFKTLLIPNWISLALIAAFIPFAVLHVPLDAILGHLLAMGIILILSISFFVAGWMGGGDVKLMSAIALWMGPDHVAPFTILMALFGAVLALGLLGMAKFGPLLGPHLLDRAIPKRLDELASSRQCPYGVAIGVAGLILSFDVFAALPAS